ncbi:hypothetical protein H8K38_01390 [Undibacterium sp. FT79W]|uniref:hypothetical protein n=1 Tax=Undibacterium sp. FT79W TaxID=2762296 RepID=UPI00164BAB54|nr:hypothetical protein [Undibacterium sp. FT79W]MBC3876452.1 hypothetical protein [Undibacterium sp. FT79W]
MSLLLNEITVYSLLIRYIVYKKSSNFKDKNCPEFAALFNQSVQYDRVVEIASTHPGNNAEICQTGVFSK